MAVRAILKKIFPQTRCLMEGVQRIHLYSGGIGNDRGGGSYLGNREEPQRSDLEPKVVWKEGKRWSDEYLRILWKQRNEGERRSYLDLRSCSFWVKAIHEVLNNEIKEEKLQAGDHRLLLFMKILKPDGTYSNKNTGSLGAVEFTTASPHTGLLHKSQKLLIDRSYELPRQTVNGLVCITTHGAFLIYNPATGDMSPWIATPAKKRRLVETIALGYNPKTDEYAVVCISKSLKKNTRVIEVMTLGERRWRRVTTTKLAEALYCDTNKHKIVGDPCYIDGVIHWRFMQFGGRQTILTFDIESAELDNFPIHPGSLSPGSRLLEVDGRVAVFKRISDHEASLWVIRAYEDDTVAWFEEKITMPCASIGDPELSIEALAGTNLILIKQEYQNCISCYNRKTKKYQDFPVSPDSGPRYDWGRILQL